MSWTKKNVHPGKIVSTSQEVDVVVLDVDASKRRISLGLKQAQDNPWDAFVAANPIGSTVEGEVKNATEFGLFIGLDNDIDGMVHLSDLDWNVSGEEAIQRYRKGEMVKAKVLDVDVEKERVSLGIKQLGGDPVGEGDTYKKGQTVTVTVTSIESGGIEVKFGEDDAPVTSFMRKSDLSPRPQRAAPRALRRRRPRRRPDHRHRQGHAPRLGLDQGAGNGRREGSHRTVRFVGLGRIAGRHPGRRPAREGQTGLTPGELARLRRDSRRGEDS